MSDEVAVTSADIHTLMWLLEEHGPPREDDEPFRAALPHLPPEELAPLLQHLVALRHTICVLGVDLVEERIEEDEALGRILAREPRMLRETALEFLNYWATVALRDGYGTRRYRGG